MASKDQQQAAERDGEDDQVRSLKDSSIVTPQATGYHTIENRLCGGGHDI